MKGSGRFIVREGSSRFTVVRSHHSPQNGPSLTLRSDCRYCGSRYHLRLPAPLARSALLGSCPKCRKPGRDDHPRKIGARLKARGMARWAFGHKQGGG